MGVPAWDLAGPAAILLGVGRIHPLEQTFTCSRIQHRYCVSGPGSAEQSGAVPADPSDPRANWEMIWTISRQAKGKPHFLRALEQFYAVPNFGQ